MDITIKGGLVPVKVIDGVVYIESDAANILTSNEIRYIQENFKDITPSKIEKFFEKKLFIKLLKTKYRELINLKKIKIEKLPSLLILDPSYSNRFDLEFISQSSNAMRYAIIYDPELIHKLDIASINPWDAVQIIVNRPELFEYFLNLEYGWHDIINIYKVIGDRVSELKFSHLKEGQVFNLIYNNLDFVKFLHGKNSFLEKELKIIMSPQYLSRRTSYAEKYIDKDWGTLLHIISHYVEVPEDMINLRKE